MYCRPDLMVPLKYFLANGVVRPTRPLYDYDVTIDECYVVLLLITDIWCKECIFSYDVKKFYESTNNKKNTEDNQARS